MQKEQFTRTREINTYLDYELCQKLGRTLDELDSIALTQLEKLRESFWNDGIAEGIPEKLI